MQKNNLRATQLLLVHSKRQNTIEYLGIEDVIEVLAKTFYLD